ncbi:MAG TPA: V-type ATP synthase subunit E family protein [Methanomassiliicoccales archaeon]|nr:V-type ATP synthase subunit E family protein [Methanomassiliicoccales archaeon]
MALDEVINNVSEGAQVKARELSAEAEKERAAILKQADDKVAAKRLAQQKELEVALKRLKQQEISSAELEAKRVILNAKKDVLDHSFQVALDSLLNMDEGNRGRMYRKILEGGKTVIKAPKVYCPRGESKLISAVSGLGSVIETDMEAGVILEDASGIVRLDYRFRVLLESVWDKELKNVSNILFG